MQSDPVTTIPAPITRDADLFDILKGNRIMTAINAELVPIMIADEGPDFEFHVMLMFPVLVMLII